MLSGMLVHSLLNKEKKISFPLKDYPQVCDCSIGSMIYTWSVLSSQGIVSRVYKMLASRVGNLNQK